MGFQQFAAAAWANSPELPPSLAGSSRLLSSCTQIQVARALWEQLGEMIRELEERLGSWGMKPGTGGLFMELGECPKLAGWPVGWGGSHAAATTAATPWSSAQLHRQVAAVVVAAWGDGSLGSRGHWGGGVSWPQLWHCSASSSS